MFGAGVQTYELARETLPLSLPPGDSGQVAAAPPCPPSADAALRRRPVFQQPVLPRVLRGQRPRACVQCTHCADRHASLSPPVHGPPEVFDIEEFERQADWDDFYESEELMKAHAENWAA